jgi:hypothetical protein
MSLPTVCHLMPVLVMSLLSLPPAPLAALFRARPIANRLQPVA